MTKTTSSLFIATLLGLGLHVAPAHAQLARTHVSSLGNDANDCGRLTPCRTFQRAHNNTLANGEITVLDPGGYGAVTINRTISIINDGVGEAGTLVSGGLVGITVNAGPNDRVSLRGLTIKGIGFGGGNGIVFNSGKSLTVENCAIRNLTGDAVQMPGNIPAGNRISFIISHSIVADTEANGLFIQPSGNGDLDVILNRVEVYNNGAHGIAADSSKLFGGGVIRTTVTDSVSAGNSLFGIIASGEDNGGHSIMRVVRSLISNNNTGVGTSVVGGPFYLTQSVLTGNHSNGTGIISYGDNVFDIGGPALTLPKQ